MTKRLSGWCAVAAFGIELAPCGCDPSWNAGGFGAPQQKVAATKDVPPAQESLYADPLTFESRGDGRAAASQQEVLSFLDRLPKSTATEPGAEVSPTPPAARTRAASPRLEPSTVAAPAESSPASKDAHEGEPREDSGVAANSAVQIPVAGDHAGDENAAGASAAKPKSAPKLESLTIRPADEPAPAEGTVDVDHSTTNAGLAADPQRERSLEAIIEAWRQRVREKPDDIEGQWRLRTLLLAAGRDQEALESLTPPSSPHAAWVIDALRAAAAVRRAAESPTSGADDALAEWQTVRDKLRPAAELAIPDVALCTRVTAFGVYDEMPSGSFVTGGVNRAIVYCEVRNFASEAKDEGRYRSLLSSRLELLTPEGQSVWQKEEPEIEDVSRRRREDFFLAQKVTLPPTLAAGEYVLKVTIADKLAQKANEAVIPLRVLPGGTARVDAK